MFAYGLASGPWSPMVLAAAHLLPVMHPCTLVECHLIYVEIAALFQQIWMKIGIIFDAAVAFTVSGEHDVASVGHY